MGRAKRFGHAQFHKGWMKGDDPKMDTAQTPKRFDWRLSLLGKIPKTFTDSIPNGGVTGGYAIPHFRNFSALFPQIRRQKLAISAILWGYEQSLPTSYKTQHTGTCTPKTKVPQKPQGQLKGNIYRRSTYNIKLLLINDA